MSASSTWVVTAEERSKHEKTFLSLKPSNGRITGEQAKKFFLSSNLPPITLGQIWNLADFDKDGQMTQQEFSIAMHLIQCKLKGINLPTSLPMSLKTSSRGNVAASLLNPPIENGFNNSPSSQNTIQSTGWSSTIASGPAQSTGWSVGLASSLPPPLLPVNSQMQTSSAPGMGRPPSSSSTNFGPTFGMPTSNGLGISSVSMAAPMPVVNPVMSSVPMAVSSMTGVSQPLRQHPVARTPSFSSMPPQTLSSDVSLGPISANSRLKYNQLFKANDYEKTGFLTGEQSRKIFLQSHLPPQILAQIWNLSDIDKDGQLNMEEFAIGMHLVDSAKAGIPLPSVLPSNLVSQQYKRSLSESNPVEADVMESNMSGQPGLQRSSSVSSGNEEGSVFKSGKTFEDKRKQNFERGRLELERRRQEMQEQQQREKDERERKERLEEERRQRAKIEAEQKRQAELGKQRQQQLEMEREQEALRKKMIQQRLQAQIEAERQRQLEWEKRKKEELLNNKSLEKDIVTGLQARKDKMVMEADNLGKRIESLREDIKNQRKFHAECIVTTDALIKSREKKIAEIADLENKRKICYQQLPGLSSEQDRLQRELNKRDSSIMDEAYGNALASIEDTNSGIRRREANKNNLITEQETKRKMTFQLNQELKENRSELQRQTDENTRLRQTVELKKNEYLAMKQRQEEEKKRKREEELRQRREAEARRKKEEEERRQKEREMEAMRQEREQQRLEQERRQRLEQQRIEQERQRKIQEQQRLEQEKQKKLQQELRLEQERQQKLREQQRLEQERQQKLQEQQRVEQEQHKLQEAQASEAKRQVQLRQEDLVNKDKIVQEQATLLAKSWKPTKPLPYNKSEKEAEVRKKVQEMQKKRNELKKEKDNSQTNLIGQASQSADASKERKEFHKVIYSFSPRNPDELTLVEGDVVAVFPDHPKVPPGWVYGECKDRKGLFPANYAEKLPESKGDYVDITPVPSSSSQPSTGRRSVSSIIAALNSQDKLPIAPSMPAEGEREVKEEIKPQTTVDNNAVVIPEGLQATAIYQHRGKTETELSFNKNDVITVKEQKGMSWFGELNGKTGWFPKSYAKLVRGQRRGEGSTSDDFPDKTTAQIPSSNDSAFQEVPENRVNEPTVLGECIALYAYNGEAGDLNFKEGDVISITKSDGDWWEGVLNGQKGIFPANYVKRKEPEAPRSSTKRPEIATVTTAYTATSAEQLSLVPGQYIAVKTKSPNGWWEGQLQARGKKRQSGWFPASCVKLLSSGGGAGSGGTGNESLKSNDGGLYARRGSNTPQNENESESIYSVPSSAKRRTETIDQVLAMFSYTAQNSDELTFYKGSVITVLNREGDWWQGELNGQVGMFPNNYVQPLTDLPTTTQWTGTWDRKLLDSMTSMERDRQNSIYELINTEQTYVDDMSLTLEVFYNPIAASKILSEGELTTIFVNWEQLIFCSVKLLKAFLVRKKMNNAGQIYVIGDILCEQLPRLTPYIRFCSCQLKACKLLQNKIETVPEFKALEKKCCQDPRTRGLPLSSYLLKPLQRVTKYPLLIKKILEDTPEAHSDRGDLEIALEKAEDLCQQVNEGVRSQEDTDRLEFMQTHISTEGLDERLIFNSQTNCLGQRKFVYEGTLFKHKSGKELRTFLCNDFLLLTREVTSLAKKMGKDSDKRYAMYQPPIRLNEITVKLPDQNSEETLFQVSHIDRVYLLRAETKNERITWVRKLRRASEQYIETERLQRQKAYRARSFRADNIGKLSVIIIEGSDLKASDPNGLSDPYCEVSLGGQEHKTKAITNTLNPKWNSSMQFSLRDLRQDVLCISVFDQDMYSPNDFLGRTEVSIAGLLKEGKGPWQKRLLLHEVTTGEILVRLELQLYKSTK